MALEISCYDIIGIVDRGGGEVGPRPEPLPPVPLSDVFKFLLDHPGRAPLCMLHEPTDRNVRWYLDEKMQMISRKNAIDDRHAHLAANLADDLPYPDAHVTEEHLVSILERPHDVVPVVKKCVAAAAIHDRVEG